MYTRKSWYILNVWCLAGFNICCSNTTETRNSRLCFDTSLQKSILFRVETDLQTLMKFSNFLLVHPPFVGKGAVGTRRIRKHVLDEINLVRQRVGLLDLNLIAGNIIACSTILALLDQSVGQSVPTDPNLCSRVSCSIHANRLPSVYRGDVVEILQSYGQNLWVCNIFFHCIPNLLSLAHGVSVHQSLFT